MNNVFLESEMRIIRELKPHWAALIAEERWKDGGIITTFAMLAEHCFVYDVRTPAAEAFRKAYRALLEFAVTRGSAEYEQLLNY